MFASYYVRMVYSKYVSCYMHVSHYVRIDILAPVLFFIFYSCLFVRALLYNEGWRICFVVVAVDDNDGVVDDDGIVVDCHIMICISPPYHMGPQDNRKVCHQRKTGTSLPPPPPLPLVCMQLRPASENTQSPRRRPISEQQQRRGHVF